MDHTNTSIDLLQVINTFFTYGCIEYISPWAGLELTSFVAIGTDCRCRHISYYHVTTATVVLVKLT